MKLANTKIDIANYFMLIIIINLLLHFSTPIKQIISFPFKWIGLFLFILGWIPNVWVGIYFRKLKTSISSNKKPKKLITFGLFKFSRNPLYLGMIVALFGEAIFLGSIVTFILPFFFALFINYINIPREEKNMEKKFGRKYLEFKKRVRRWI
jgi:protein-S-isoprenylcysteine O-methyltransferase Ste14